MNRIYNPNDLFVLPENSLTTYRSSNQEQSSGLSPKVASQVCINAMRFKRGVANADSRLAPALGANLMGWILRADCDMVMLVFQVRPPTVHHDADRGSVCFFNR
jgi:hypothetical protein